MSFLSKVKDGLNKLIGTPTDAQSVALARKVDECTSASIAQPDWNLHLQLCQLITFGDVGCGLDLACIYIRWCLPLPDRNVFAILQQELLLIFLSTVDHCTGQTVKHP